MSEKNIEQALKHTPTIEIDNIQKVQPHNSIDNALRAVRAIISLTRKTVVHSARFK